MTLQANMATPDIPDQQVIILGTMRIMTTGTGKWKTGPQRVRFAFNRMLLDRVPLCNVLHPGMTADTEVVDLLKQLETVVGCMRAMTGHTPPGTEDPVNFETFLAAIKIFLLVFMTDHT